MSGASDDPDGVTRSGGSGDDSRSLLWLVGGSVLGVVATGAVVVIALGVLLSTLTFPVCGCSPPPEWTPETDPVNDTVTVQYRGSSSITADQASEVVVVSGDREPVTWSLPIEEGDRFTVPAEQGEEVRVVSRDDDGERQVQYEHDVRGVFELRTIRNGSAVLTSSLVGELPPGATVAVLVDGERRVTIETPVAWDRTVQVPVSSNATVTTVLVDGDDRTVLHRWTIGE